MPKINERSEIIRILDDLLAKEQQAKDAAEGVLEQIDLIKKTILSRAFRSELGTNDPPRGECGEITESYCAAIVKSNLQRVSSGLIAARKR